MSLLTMSLQLGAMCPPSLMSPRLNLYLPDDQYCPSRWNGQPSTAAAHSMSNTVSGTACSHTSPRRLWREFVAMPLLEQNQVYNASLVFPMHAVQVGSTAAAAYCHSSIFAVPAMYEGGCRHGVSALSAQGWKGNWMAGQATPARLHAYHSTEDCFAARQGAPQGQGPVRWVTGCGAARVQQRSCSPRPILPQLMAQRKGEAQGMNMWHCSARCILNLEWQAKQTVHRALRVRCALGCQLLQHCNYPLFRPEALCQSSRPSTMG